MQVHTACLECFILEDQRRPSDQCFHRSLQHGLPHVSAVVIVEAKQDDAATRFHTTVNASPTRRRTMEDPTRLPGFPAKLPQQIRVIVMREPRDLCSSDLPIQLPFLDLGCHACLIWVHTVLIQPRLMQPRLMQPRMTQPRTMKPSPGSAPDSKNESSCPLGRQARS